MQSPTSAIANVLEGLAQVKFFASKKWVHIWAVIYL